MILPLKYKFVIISLLIFFFQNGIGQSEPREIKYFDYEKDFQTNSFWKIYETASSYNNQGNISAKIIKLYNYDGTIKKWQREVSDYNEFNLLERYTYQRYNQDVDLWITTAWIDYKYDQNGCRIEEQRTNNIGGQINRRVTYTRNSNCRITSELVEWSTNGIDLSTKDFYTRVYHDDEISYDEIFYSYSVVGDSLYLQKNRKVIYDQNENIIEAEWIIFYATGDTLFDGKNSYLYDEFNNVILNSEYDRIQNTNDWELRSQFIYENIYDEDSFLIQKNRESWNYDNPNFPVENLNSRRKYIYQNSCEGLVESYTKTNGQFASENRYEFIYEGINECLDVENLDVKISISPNPSNGEIKISSPIFQSGNTDILVLTTDGKALLQNKEKSRCESSFIDLTSLQNGIYILQLQNGDHFVTEKIVIAN